MMMDAFMDALATVLTVDHIMYLMLGVFVGLIVGVLPGLGGIVGMSLLLPFVYGMEPTQALAMLIGILPVLSTSDTFASVLMGIPGSSASQATILDGFPMSKKGEAARALAAAFSSSFVGGIVGAIVLSLCVVIARPLILCFGAAELFMLTLFGLSMVGVLSGSSLTKGIAACAAGLALGSIGAAPATGEYRMDFDLLYLMDGIPLVIVGLGIFAIPEIGDLLRQQGSIAKQPSRLGKGWLQGLKDTWISRWLVLRCSALGSLLGAIPGLGGSVVDWIAYGHVVQTAKDKSQFGKGDVRGVIAPESTTAAKDGGGLIPTLLFGIPGSGSMAIFLAGMILIGLQPGPAMVGANLDITYTIVWSLAVANIIGTALCIVLAPGIAKLTQVRYPLIAPFMIAIVAFAAFQPTRSLSDLVALLGVGVFGILLRRFGWPRPAFLIGFVLATQSERYLYQAVQFSGFDFFYSPVVLIIAAIIGLSVWLGARSGKQGGSFDTEKSNSDEVSSDRPTSFGPQIVFTLVIAGIFLFTAYESWDLSFLGGIFTTGVAVVGLVATGLVLYPQLTGKVASGANYDAEAGYRGEDHVPPLAYIGWLAAFVGSMALVGFFASLVLFFVAFLKIVAKASWLTTALLTVAISTVMLVLASSLNLTFPAGYLQSAMDLPWPFR